MGIFLIVIIGSLFLGLLLSGIFKKKKIFPLPTLTPTPFPTLTPTPTPSGGGKMITLNKTILRDLDDSIDVNPDKVSEYGVSMIVELRFEIIGMMSIPLYLEPGEFIVSSPLPKHVPEGVRLKSAIITNIIKEPGDMNTYLDGTTREVFI